VTQARGRPVRQLPDLTGPSQAAWAAAISPASEAEIEQSRQLYVEAGIDQETIDDLLAAQLKGVPAKSSTTTRTACT
jgi:hypothetical protein